MINGLAEWLDNWYDGYYEAVLESLSENFYNAHEDWVLDSDLIDDWVNKLSIKEIEPEHAARIIERAHKLYRI